VQFNADSMVSNRDGLSALMVASSAGAHLLVQALLKHQQGKGDEKVASMLGHRDAQGSTALHFAARNGELHQAPVVM
jgi:ankyrin repeat protein